MGEWTLLASLLMRGGLRIGSVGRGVHISFTTHQHGDTPSQFLHLSIWNDHRDVYGLGTKE